jgi:hypothetical protein
MPHPSVASVSELRGLCDPKRTDALIAFGFGVAELGHFAYFVGPLVRPRTGLVQFAAVDSGWV